jgi:hypothetical protein
MRIEDQTYFDTSVQVGVGNGRSTLFCRDKWINDLSAKQIDPIMDKVRKRFVGNNHFNPSISLAEFWSGGSR